MNWPNDKILIVHLNFVSIVPAVQAALSTQFTNECIYPVRHVYSNRSLKQLVVDAVQARRWPARDLLSLCQVRLLKPKGRPKTDGQHLLHTSGIGVQNIWHVLHIDPFPTSNL